MKKLILLLSIITISFSTSAQDSSKLTVKGVYNDVKSGITELAAKLEGPAKHVYKVYVYQHRAEGITFMLIPMVIFIFGLPLVLLNYKKADFEEGNKAAFASGAGVLLNTVAIICLIVFFVNYFTKIINPEYHAIQDIIKAFK